MAVPALLPRRRSRLPAVLQLAVAFWLAATSSCLCRAVPAPWSTGLIPPDYPRTGPLPHCHYLPCGRPPPTPHLPPPSSPPPPLLSPPPPAVTLPPPPAPGHHIPPHCFGRFCPRPPVCPPWKHGCGGGHGSPP
ncbi:hypothetical protein BS78_05G175400 [Paspalum vaginatum]|nr:hypothetical protein BS78_05G175400 [Paspalum vaginatum]